MIPTANKFIRFTVAITFPIANFSLNFLNYLLRRPKITLPEIDNKILLLSATELAEKIRKRQLRCKDVMQAYIQGSQLVHPHINAVTDARYEDALLDAVAVDNFLESGEKTEDQIARDTPLLGVPFSCKESLGVKGLLQTSGLVTAKSHVAEEDSDAVVFYRKAGAIPVTVSNVSEMCMWWESHNHIFGVTKNPYNNTRTPGGSTGGEAALIASAGAVIGIGTDIAASLRLPASFCGIYGHKPTRGIVSNWGTFPHCQMSSEKKDSRTIDTFVSTGPMCRYAEDLPLLLKVLSNYDKRIKLDEKVDFRIVKVYFMTDIPGLINGCEPDIKNSIIEAAKYFEETFHIKASPVNITEMKDGFPMLWAKFAEVGCPPMEAGLAYGKKSINVWWELFKSTFRLSDHTLPLLLLSAVGLPKEDKNYYDTLENYKSLQKKFEDILQGDAILLLPTHPEPAPHHLMTVPKMLNVAYTCVFNILGYPVTSVPTGFSKGLPFGLQVVSGQFKDHLTIAAAQELDKVFGGWKSPCQVEV